MPDPDQAAFSEKPEIGDDFLKRYGVPLSGWEPRMLGHSLRAWPDSLAFATVNPGASSSAYRQACYAQGRKGLGHFP